MNHRRLTAVVFAVASASAYRAGGETAAAVNPVDPLAWLAARPRPAEILEIGFAHLTHIGPN
jgi:hypothetical protein